MPPRTHKPTQPNIFLMLTDDQDIVLGSMNAMSFTRSLAAQVGYEQHTVACVPWG